MHVGQHQILEAGLLIIRSCNCNLEELFHLDDDLQDLVLHNPQRVASVPKTRSWETREYIYFSKTQIALAYIYWL